MSALTIDQVLALKKAVQDKLGVYVHMHDTCGAQTFSVEKSAMTPELRSFLETYFQKLGSTVQISDDGYFSVKR